MESQNSNRYLILLGTIIVQFALGSIYAWSIFNEPLAIENSWTIQQVIVCFSITSLSLAIGTLFAAKIQNMIGIKYTLSICGILIGVALYIAAFTSSLLVLYLTAGIVVGFCNGVAYILSLSNCLAWFSNNKGLAGGITLSAYGLGAFAFKYIHVYTLETYGLDAAFWIWGAILAILTIIGACFILEAPKVCAKVENNVCVAKDYTRMEVLSSPQAWLLFIALFTSCMGGLYIIGRLILGSLSDKLGYARTLALSFAIIVVSTGILAFTNLVYFTFLIAIAGVAFSFGGNLSIFPDIVGKYFGLNNHSKNYSLIYQGFGLGALTGGQIALMTGGLRPTFVLIFALAIVSFIILVLIRAPKDSISS